jgi:hypothetical protein
MAHRPSIAPELHPATVVCAGALDFVGCLWSATTSDPAGGFESAGGALDVSRW